jgi:carboxymethylenebutenolidase
MGETIELSNGAGAYRATPSSGEGSGVLVLHAWWGLNETIRDVCDRLAEAGFVALAPDLFDGEVVDTPEAAEELAGRKEQTDLGPKVQAGLDRLRGEPGVAADAVGLLGFSFGAAHALLSGASDPTVAALVVCYGTAGTVDWSGSQAAVQGHFAENDPYEPPENVDDLERALRDAGRRVEVFRYPGTSHWFLEPDRPEYDEAAATLAWGRIMAFLRERLP